jgi:hypothetical protein
MVHNVAPDLVLRHPVGDLNGGPGFECVKNSRGKNEQKTTPPAMTAANAVIS